MRRVTPRLSVLLAGGLGLLLGGPSCTHSEAPVSLAPPDRAARELPYEELLNRWTRSARVVRQLDTELKVHATWFSPEFQQAHVKQLGTLFRLPTDRRAQLRQELAQAWQQQYDFVFGAATHDISWNDFHRRGTVWRVSLANDRGEQVSASKIERFKRITATERVLYPYLGAFYQLYRVRFPRKLTDGRELIRSGTEHVSLRFAGALGQAELIWRLR